MVKQFIEFPNLFRTCRFTLKNGNQCGKGFSNMTDLKNHQIAQKHMKEVQVDNKKEKLGVKKPKFKLAKV
jgi:hypothetical protein